MAKKKNKILDEIRTKRLDSSEKYKGAFQARTKVNKKWIFTLGPFAGLTAKPYQIVVTDKKMIFGKLSFSGKLLETEKYGFKEIKKIVFKKGVLTYRITIDFINGKNLDLEASFRGIRTPEGFLIEEKLISQISGLIADVRGLA